MLNTTVLKVTFMFYCLSLTVSDTRGSHNKQVTEDSADVAVRSGDVTDSALRVKRHAVDPKDAKARADFNTKRTAIFKRWDHVIPKYQDKFRAAKGMYEFMMMKCKAKMLKRRFLRAAAATPTPGVPTPANPVTTAAPQNTVVMSTKKTVLSKKPVTQQSIEELRKSIMAMEIKMAQNRLMEHVKRNSAGIQQEKLRLQILGINAEMLKVRLACRTKGRVKRSHKWRKKKLGMETREPRPPKPLDTEGANRYFTLKLQFRKYYMKTQVETYKAGAKYYKKLYKKWEPKCRKNPVEQNRVRRSDPAEDKTTKMELTVKYKRLQNVMHDDERLQEDQVLNAEGEVKRLQVILTGLKMRQQALNQKCGVAGRKSRWAGRVRRDARAAREDRNKRGAGRLIIIHMLQKPSFEHQPIRNEREAGQPITSQPPAPTQPAGTKQPAPTQPAGTHKAAPTQPASTETPAARVRPTGGSTTWSVMMNPRGRRERKDQDRAAWPGMDSFFQQIKKRVGAMMEVAFTKFSWIKPGKEARQTTHHS